MKKVISLLGKNITFTWKVLKLLSPFLVVALAMLFVFLWGMDRVDSGRWHSPKELLRRKLFTVATEEGMESRAKSAAGASPAEDPSVQKKARNDRRLSEGEARSWCERLELLKQEVREREAKLDSAQTAFKTERALLEPLQMQLAVLAGTLLPESAVTAADMKDSARIKVMVEQLKTLKQRKSMAAEMKASIGEMTAERAAELFIELLGGEVAGNQEQVRLAREVFFAIGDAKERATILDEVVKSEPKKAVLLFLNGKQGTQTTTEK